MPFSIPEYHAKSPIAFSVVQQYKGLNPGTYTELPPQPIYFLFWESVSLNCLVWTRIMIFLPQPPIELGLDVCPPRLTAFSSHLSLGSCQLGKCLRFSLFLLTLAVLRCIGQLFCRVSLIRGLSKVFLMIRPNWKIPEA